jgi:acyl-coenzyme A thioesterase PaaI-like protein
MYLSAVDWQGTERAGGPEFAELVESVRAVTESVSGVVAPADVLEEASRHLTEAVALLGPWRSDIEGEPFAGRRGDLPGRGHPQLPPYSVDRAADGAMAGRVTFSRAQEGAGGAAHGGAISWLFDEALGLCVSTVAPTARTAYLKVDFRNLVPLSTELFVTAQVVRTDGRKLWVEAVLTNGTTPLAHGEGLFVQVDRPAALT